MEITTQMALFLGIIIYTLGVISGIVVTLVTLIYLKTRTITMRSESRGRYAG